MAGYGRQLAHRPAGDVRDIELRLVRLRRVGEEGQGFPVGAEVEVVLVVRLAVLPGGETHRGSARRAESEAALANLR